MRRWVAAVVVGVLSVVVLAYVSVDEDILPLTDHLSQDASTGDGDYTVRFFENEQTGKVASVYVRHGEVDDGLYRLMIEVWHQEKTILDSLSLEFNTLRPAKALWMETPSGYPWPPLEYRSSLGPGQDDVTGGVIVHIPDLGFQGKGTVRLVFYLRADLLQPQPTEALGLDVALSMHRDGLVNLTKKRAETTIPLDLTANGTELSKRLGAGS